MIPLPWLLGGAVIAILGALGAGYKLGSDVTEGRFLKAAEARQSALERRRGTRAAKVAVITVQGSTIQEKVRVQTVEVPVYRECRATPDVVLGINAALVGTGPAGDRELP